MFFICRFVRDKAISKLKGATQRLRDKECSIWIFPEGTRFTYIISKNNQIFKKSKKKLFYIHRNHKDSSVLLPFKKGAFHIAVQAQTPIVPVGKIALKKKKKLIIIIIIKMKKKKKVTSDQSVLFDPKNGHWRGGEVNIFILIKFDFCF